jgi:uncharacterized protein (TIGR00730 family)
VARPRRRYELRNAELNAKIEELIALAAVTYEARDERADYVRQMLVTGLGLLGDDCSTGDLKLLNSTLKELRHAFRVFAPWAHVRKVAVFGSARTRPEHPDFEQARSFAERIVAAGWMVITGAGDGIMGAAQGGAGREASFGVNIRLPFEQQANPVIAGDPKLINFRYFFSRKLAFVKNSHAIALFPGGFGTHDEGFEALTLIQTGKSEMLPVVFVDAPGGSYWRDWQEYLHSHLLARRLISEEDLSLFKVTDDVDEAVAELTGFYRNYHSSRYVRDLLVIRVREAPDAEELAALNAEFGDILAEGAIEVRGALPEEGGEADPFPRVLLHFDRKKMGRLRQLIDRLNALAEPEVSASDAAPHEIVAAPLPPEAERAERSGA